MCCDKWKSMNLATFMKFQNTLNLWAEGNGEAYVDSRLTGYVALEKLFMYYLPEEINFARDLFSSALICTSARAVAHKLKVRKKTIFWGFQKLSLNFKTYLRKVWSYF